MLSPYLILSEHYRIMYLCIYVPVALYPCTQFQPDQDE